MEPHEAESEENLGIFERLENAAAEIQRLDVSIINEAAEVFHGLNLAGVASTIQGGAEATSLLSGSSTQIGVVLQPEDGVLAETLRVTEELGRLNGEILAEGVEAAKSFTQLRLGSYDLVSRTAEVAQAFRSLPLGTITEVADTCTRLGQVLTAYVPIAPQGPSFSIAAALAPLRSFSETVGTRISTALTELSSIGASPLPQLMAQANVSILRIAEAVQPTLVTTEIQGPYSAAWREEISPLLVSAEPLRSIGSALSTYLGEISEATIFAQGALSGISLGEVGSAIRLPVAQRTVLGNSFQDLARSYTDLFQSIEKAPFSVLSVPPAVTRMPPEELFYSVNLLEAISVEEARRTEPRDWRRARERVSPYSEDEFPTLLSSLNPGFVRMWKGALKSFQADDDPDRVRHYGVSLRELLTQVLHHLSPDKEVRAWSQTPEHYHNNQPTRRARLQYICRNIDHGPFHVFFDKDIAAIERLFDVFQQTTHAVLVECTPAQLNALRIKVEHTIRWLVTLAQEAKC